MDRKPTPPGAPGFRMNHVQLQKPPPASLAGIHPAIPFVFAGRPLSHQMPLGTGVVIQATLPNANQDYTIAHTLNRVPTTIHVLENAPGSFSPKWTRSTVTAWTAQAVTIQVDTPCPAPGAFFWIV